MYNRLQLLLAVAALALVLAVPFRAEKYYQHPPKYADIYNNHKQHNAQSDKINTTNEMSIVDLFNWIENKHDFIIASGTVALAIFTLALFAATVGLVIFAIIQARDMNRLARATRRSARSTRRAAIAAEHQVKIMAATYAANVTIVTPQSRSVFIDPLNGTPRVFRGVEFLVRLKNHGQSATRNMESTISATVLPIKQKFVFAFPGAVANAPHAMVIGGSSELNTGGVEILATLSLSSNRRTGGFVPLRMGRI